MPHFNEHALEMAIMELFQQKDYLQEGKQDKGSGLYQAIE